MAVDARDGLTRSTSNGPGCRPLGIRVRSSLRAKTYGEGMVVVRTARFPRDAAAVAALVGEYLHRTELEKAERGLVASGAPLPARYAREIDAPAKAFVAARVLLASVDGVDSGVVVVRATPRATELSRFWTAPSARGRGVGSALLDAALSGTDTPVRLSVWRWRDDAVRLYRGRGFEVVASWDDRADLLCLERAMPLSARS